MVSLCGWHQRGFWDDFPIISLRHQPPRFMAHLHQAPSWLHVDLRVQVSGVFWSWAFYYKHLLNLYEPCKAAHVNDHSLSCFSDEGITISERGLGHRLVLDQGTYTIENALSRKPLYRAMKDALYWGKIRIVLEGTKLRGVFTLTRKSRLNDKEWYLQKEWDKYALDVDEPMNLRSVVTGRDLNEIQRDSWAGMN